MTDRKIRQLKDQAAQYIEKQKYEKALDIYETLQRDRPNDTAIMLKLGELNRRVGHHQAAVVAYTMAADRFAEDGLLLKGIAVCKIILDIDPGNRNVADQLARLYTSKYGGLPQTETRVGTQTPSVPDERARESTEAPSEEEMALDIEVDATAFEPSTADKLSEIPLLGDLDRASFVELLSNVPLHRLDKDEIVIREDEEGQSFFILVEGGVRIVKHPDIPLGTLGPGAFFGEMAIIAPHRRRASVITTTPSELIEISKEHLDALTRRYPGIFNVLSRFTHERLLKNLMATSPLFSPFPPSEQLELIKKFQPVKYIKGQTVLEQDGETKGLFLIASGTVQIERGGAIVSTLSEGEMFGEASLLLRSNATCTVRAAENTGLLLLPKAVFNELIMTHPQILELVSNLKADREQNVTLESFLPRDLMSELDGGGALL